jgi:hypothetical protein
MTCEEQQRLLVEYTAAVMELSNATTALANMAGQSTSEYQLLRREVDSAKARARKAKITYDEHIATHGCDVLRAQGRSLRRG